MIKYAVQCKKGHGFEAWFQNSDAFDKQTKRGLLACPDCGSTKITKALMAPNVSARTRKAKSVTMPAGKPSSQATQPPQPNRAVAASPMGLPAEMVEVLRRIKQEVETKADYVGPKFAEEARKIHYNEVPERGIYGEASLEDVKDLLDEGIDCLPLPVLPEDRN